MVRLDAARLKNMANDALQAVRLRATAMMSEESGQDVIEYALICVFMALAGVALLSGLESMLANTFNHFGTVLTTSV